MKVTICDMCGKEIKGELPVICTVKDFKQLRAFNKAYELHPECAKLLCEVMENMPSSFMEKVHYEE